MAGRSEIGAPRLEPDRMSEIFTRGSSGIGYIDEPWSKAQQVQRGSSAVSLLQPCENGISRTKMKSSGSSRSCLKRRMTGI